MKKSLVIILCVFIGSFIYVQILKPDVIHQEPAVSYPGVYISLEGVEELDIEYSDVKEIIIPFVELGCMYVEINDFRWEVCGSGFYLFPDDEEEEYLITIKKNKSDTDPSPENQYDLRAIQNWCKRNTGKYSEIHFGDGVKFNVIEKVSQIFFKYEVPYFLLNLPEEDSTDIRIRLCQPVPKQITEPNNRAIECKRPTFHPC